MVIEEDMAVKNLSHREERSLVKQPYVKLRWSQCIFTQIEGKWGLS